MSRPNKATRVHHFAGSAKKQRGNRASAGRDLPGWDREWKERNAGERWNEQASRHLLLAAIVFLFFSIFYIRPFYIRLHPLVFFSSFFSFFLILPYRLPAIHRSSLKVVLKRGDDTTTACLKGNVFVMFFCDYTLFSRYIEIDIKSICRSCYRLN